MARVSVIIPCHNACDYIGATINSVLAQTLPPAEIIVIDDGSTDDSREVVRRFDGRVRLLTKANGGPASARNLGIASSTGDYIAFLDSDDLWMSDKLARQVAFMASHPEVGLLFSEAWMFRETDGEKVISRKIGFTGDPTFRQLLHGDFIPNSTVLLRRECVERVGPLSEKRSLIGVEDYEYWMRIARECTIAGIAEPLAWYRLREGNLMGDGRDIDKGLDLALKALGEIESRFPQMWEESGVVRERLLARLHLRAGFAWKQRGDWRGCIRHYRQALRWSRHPRVLRWMVAATVRQRWS